MRNNLSRRKSFKKKSFKRKRNLRGKSFRKNKSVRIKRGGGFTSQHCPSKIIHLKHSEDYNKKRLIFHK